jgi:hypothetical protein
MALPKATSTLADFNRYFGVSNNKKVDKEFSMLERKQKLQARGVKVKE